MNKLNKTQNFNISEGNVKLNDISGKDNKVPSKTIDHIADASKEVISKMETPTVEIPDNGIWYTERSYKELRKEKRALEVSVSNRDETIRELREENQKLKELLCECVAELEELNNPNYPAVEKLLEEINEVLK